MIDIIKAVIIGIIEGITEWLPVSSTGHIFLANEFIKLNASEQFLEMFDVVIQLGAIFAVVLLYFKKLWPFTTKANGFIKKDSFNMWFKVLVAVIPAIVIGLPFDDLLQKYFYNYLSITAVLIIYGILFIVVERINRNRTPKINDIDTLDYKTALLIGAFQVLALIPGTSRSGATILGAILLGVSRSTAAEFSFFLSVPVMFGASLLKIVKFGFDFTPTQIVILLAGMISAFLTSVLFIKLLMNYIKKRDFTVFGYYRIAIGIVLFIVFGFVLKN
ncbi:MAG: undecaprenyl-diphosphate phosphatase [Clostridia bacterium]|nr:undecaprenyl-diphosphate phosphatase [Clostridia bacterium]